jgi:hypothetical protein
LNKQNRLKKEYDPKVRIGRVVFWASNALTSKVFKARHSLGNDVSGIDHKALLEKLKQSPLDGLCQ